MAINKFLAEYLGENVLATLVTREDTQNLSLHREFTVWVLGAEAFEQFGRFTVSRTVYRSLGAQVVDFGLGLAGLFIGRAAGGQQGDEGEANDLFHACTLCRRHGGDNGEMTAAHCPVAPEGEVVTAVAACAASGCGKHDFDIGQSKPGLKQL